MSAASFKLRVLVPKKLKIRGQQHDREAFYSWVWANLAQDGLQGVHEGTILSEPPGTAETWTLDSGEAPRDRDWISGQELETADFYFSSKDGAIRAGKRLEVFEALQVGGIEEQKAEDWDAKWKASFVGAKVPPFWHVVPPWVTLPQDEKGIPIIVNPGAGFGTGTHETTQLCMRALGELAEERGGSLQGIRMLDFGSGSGILSISAAKLGARVDAVEIDPLANENALENARLNRLEDSIQIFEILPSGQKQPYQVVCANILRPVLLEFAQSLAECLTREGVLILSGLVKSDVPLVTKRYTEILGTEFKCRTFSLGEWFALVFKKS